MALLCVGLHQNFALASATAGDWIGSADLFFKLQHIFPTIELLPFRPRARGCQYLRIRIGFWHDRKWPRQKRIIKHGVPQRLARRAGAVRWFFGVT